MLKFIIASIFFTFSLILSFHNAHAMSKALNFFSGVGKKISAPFKFRKSSYSSCTSCESSYEGRKPLDGTSFPVWQYHHKGETWTNYTLDAIDREGLASFDPKDATVYCPNWKSLNVDKKRLFWLQFASKLSEIESSLNPTDSYREENGVYSNGLFSMSKGDVCGILETEADTFNEKKNIDCAIKTMKQHLSSSPYIGTDKNVGLGRYWQPLLDHPQKLVPETKANKAAILRYTRALPYCQTNSSAL